MARDAGVRKRRRRRTEEEGLQKKKGGVFVRGLRTRKRLHSVGHGDVAHGDGSVAERLGRGVVVC